MRTIETTAVVTADHTITVKLPDDVPAGEYRVVVVMANENQDRASPLPFNLIPLDLGPWPEGFTASREQLYGDDGR
jgi:hypothetical protein